MSDSRVAIVTGGSGGIGSAVAQKLSANGISVVVNYVSRPDEAKALVDEIHKGGGKAVAVQADVSNPAAARRLFDEAEAAFGGVDILVNTAGILPPELPPLASTEDDVFDRVFAINVKGTFNTLREAAKRLRKGGRIVNFSTSVVALKLPGYSAYAASKAAVETLTAILARELRGKQISVNAVAPGPTATDLFFRGKADDVIERMAKAAPLERLGTPEDIANTVAFLVGPGGGWINGQTVRANGGIA